MNQLRQEYATEGKASTFETLKVFLDPINSIAPPSYKEAAHQLQVSIGRGQDADPPVAQTLHRSMKTEDRRTCSVCGTEFSANMEFFPVCVLRRGLDEPLESDEPSLEETLVESSAALLEHRFEHYELVKGEDGKPVESGRGAIGITYKAFDVDLHCPVALKVISERYLGDESTRLRFLREARAGGSSHRFRAAGFARPSGPGA